MGDRLGFGIDGLVTGFIIASGEQMTRAIKVFVKEARYLTERDVYLRLQEHEAVSIQGHAVPQLYAFDDNLWIIEMSIVRPPFLLDFAKCDLDWATEFPEEVIAEELRKNEELFGEDWPKVQSIIAELETRFGIFFRDVHPGNIRFSD